MDLRMLELDLEQCRKIVATYDDEIASLYNEIKSDVVREEFCKGGELMHRGYYNPSPVFDIIVGNVSRGRLMKRPTPLSNPTYRYGFDRNGNLVVVDHPNGIEIMIRKGEMEFGIDFSVEDGIHTVTWCTYSNCIIQSYFFCLYTPVDRIVEYRRENYTYSEIGLESADYYQCAFMGKKPIMRYDKYHFQHDGEGFLTHYTVDEYDWEVVKDSVWKNHVFDVRIKRRV